MACGRHFVPVCGGGGNFSLSAMVSYHTIQYHMLSYPWTTPRPKDILLGGILKHCVGQKTIFGDRQTGTRSSENTIPYSSGF